MKWTILKTKEQYNKALETFEKLFFAEEGSPEFEESEALSLLIKKYEDEHHEIDTSNLDPISFLKIRMDDLNLRQKDIADTLGSASRASEVLNRKRKLTLGNIRALYAKYRIPVEVMIKDYELENDLKTA
ncbi:MAG: transcriptional regulator [Bacteroidota bacterium]